jgi:lipoate---protein ligase
MNGKIMKTGTVTRKIPGGKLVRLDVSYDTQIENVKITGDFFLHPEDVLELIQQNLAGSRLPIQKNELIEKIEQLLADQKAEFVGVSVVDLINILDEAIV